MNKKDETKQVYARRVIKSTQLSRTLDKLFQLYDEKQKPDYLVVPCILTCAAYLESKLNDSLYEINKRYGEDCAVAAMSLSLPKKLVILVPALTNGRYIINKEHFVYKRLNSLISVRNSIAHAKSNLEEISATEEELVSISILFTEMKVPKAFASPNTDLTLGTTKIYSVLEYKDALDKLDKWFFRRYPNKLDKVEMVIKKPKNIWEERYKTYIKHLK